MEMLASTVSRTGVQLPSPPSFNNFGLASPCGLPGLYFFTQMMIQEDPFAYRRIFNLSLSYGAVVFAFLSYEPLAQLLSAPVTLERVRETAGAIGALIPAGMAVAAVVAGMVRKVLFSYGGVSRRSLWVVFLVGTFWHLPLTLLLAHAAAAHEADAWMLPLWFSGIGCAASLVLLLALRRLPRAR